MAAGRVTHDAGGARHFASDAVEDAPLNARDGQRPPGHARVVYDRLDAEVGVDPHARTSQSMERHSRYILRNPKAQRLRAVMSLLFVPAVHTEVTNDLSILEFRYDVGNDATPTHIAARFPNGETVLTYDDGGNAVRHLLCADISPELKSGGAAPAHQGLAGRVIPIHNHQFRFLCVDTGRQFRVSLQDRSREGIASGCRGLPLSRSFVHVVLFQDRPLEIPVVQSRGICAPGPIQDYFAKNFA